MDKEMGGAEPAQFFEVFFGLRDGLSNERESLKRYLSDVKEIFVDGSEAEQRLQKENPLIYEYYDLKVPENEGDLAFGTSITYPGKIGKEYFMTKGHFHRILDTAEVYYCTRGRGYVMMENPEKEWDCRELVSGKVVYVPRRFAHRSINVGDEPLVTFFCFRADAGHDYETIEAHGFLKVIMEKDGKPKIIDNPNWK